MASASKVLLRIFFFLLARSPDFRPAGGLTELRRASREQLAAMQGRAAPGARSFASIWPAGLAPRLSSGSASDKAERRAHA